MKKMILASLLAGSFALPAFAQVAPPAGPAADPAQNAAIAHHDRKVARHAARHGNYRKAAAASHAANAADAQAAAPR
jgi:hypothetical protein